jgi:hypothetical protein
MGEAWQKARDARVAEHNRRQTIFSSYEMQQLMINEIKQPMVESIVSILSPGTSNVDKVKALLKARRALKTFSEKFPEPQEGIHLESGLPYVWNPNSIRLIHIRDEFFKHCKLSKSRTDFMRTGINFLIVIYDYDPPYRMMIDWWAKQLEIRNWEYGLPVKVVNYIWPWWVEDIET